MATAGVSAPVLADNTRTRRVRKGEAKRRDCLIQSYYSEALRNNVTDKTKIKWIKLWKSPN